MNLTTKTLTITACALLLTAGQTALADSAGDTFPDTATKTLGEPSIRIMDTLKSDRIMARVSYPAEKLETAEGVREIYKLLQHASKDACSGQTMQHRRTVIMKSSQLQCYRKSLTKAVSDVDNENLTRFHSG